VLAAVFVVVFCSSLWRRHKRRKCSVLRVNVDQPPPVVLLEEPPQNSTANGPPFPEHAQTQPPETDSKKLEPIDGSPPPQGTVGFSNARYAPPSYPTTQLYESKVDPPSYSEALADVAAPIGWAVDQGDEKRLLSAKEKELQNSEHRVHAV
jgi:hypothetical protein